MSEPTPQTPPVAAQPAAEGKPMVQPSGKSTTLAVILSCLIFGLGQIYLGQIAKGLVLLIAGIVLGGVTAGIGATVVWIIAMVDAYKIGKKLEAGQPVAQWEFF